MPVTLWAGGRDATNFGPPRAQASPFLRNGKDVPKEDCLYLNVRTSEWPGRSTKPVMVRILGGGNFGGAGPEPTSPRPAIPTATDSRSGRILIPHHATTSNSPLRVPSPRRFAASIL
jgi:hypothetical protein